MAVDHFCGWPEGSEQCRMWHHADKAHVPIFRAGDKERVQGPKCSHCGGTEWSIGHCLRCKRYCTEATPPELRPTTGGENG